MSLLSFIRGVRIKIGGIFLKIFGKTAAENFGKSALEILKSDLGKVVVAVVGSLSGIASGEAARSIALSRIRTVAVASGLDAKDSIINMLIELAVARLKGHFDDN